MVARRRGRAELSGASSDRRRRQRGFRQRGIDLGNRDETSIGKLPGVGTIVADLAGAIKSQGFAGLPISVRHGQAAGALPGPHRDPFDRMLIAQAMLDDLVLVSNERAFDAYGVQRLW